MYSLINTDQKHGQLVVIFLFVPMVSAYVFRSTVEHLKVLSPTTAATLRWYLSVERSTVCTIANARNDPRGIPLDHRPPWCALGQERREFV